MRFPFDEFDRSSLAEQRRKPISLKISGTNAVGRTVRVDRPETLGEYIEATLFLLQRALDDQRRGRTDQPAIALVHCRLDDDVDQARLVLEREKDETFGGAGALPGDHHAADLADEVIGHRAQTRGGD